MISNRYVVLGCSAIGATSLLLNAICLFLIWKSRKTYSPKIFIILLLLQLIYTLQNFHFAVLFIPVFYPTLGGGYCIGLLCEPHYVSFSKNAVICVLFLVNICGLFVVLLFARHQSLLRTEISPVRFGPKTQKVIEFALVAGVNLANTRFCYVHFTATSDDSISMIHKLGASCDWIRKRRNFGVLHAEDATVHIYVTAISTSLFMIFSIACAIHIFRIMSEFRELRSSTNFTLTLKQTRQSLIQIATFAAFLAVPVALFMSQTVFKFRDESIVLMPGIFLLSLNSLAHSTLTILYSPTVKANIRSVSPSTTTVA